MQLLQGRRRRGNRASIPVSDVRPRRQRSADDVAPGAGDGGRNFAAPHRQGWRCPQALRERGELLHPPEVTIDRQAQRYVSDLLGGAGLRQQDAERVAARVFVQGQLLDPLPPRGGSGGVDMQLTVAT